EPVRASMPSEDNMDTAARVLALAQQTADQAIADARREADETLGRARREADEILGKARRQAEQITSDARARAESLARDAQERHRQAMGSLVQQREELERRVDDLRAFEREYRSRLKAYLEGQLRDLEAGAGDSGTFPAVAGSVGGGMSSRMESRNGQPAVTGAYAGPPEPVGHKRGFHPRASPIHHRRYRNGPRLADRPARRAGPWEGAGDPVQRPPHRGSDGDARRRGGHGQPEPDLPVDRREHSRGVRARRRSSAPAARDFWHVWSRTGGR